MNIKYFSLAVFSLLTLLVLSISSLLAQEDDAVDDPAVTDDRMGTTIVGDPDAEALRVVQDYLATWDPNLLSDDTTYAVGADRQVDGRDMVAGEHRQFFDGTFSNTFVEPLLFVVVDDYVGVEFRLFAMHTGDFHNTPATDQDVDFLMAGIFQVQNGQITSTSLYYDEAQIWDQIGHSPMQDGFATEGEMTDPALAEPIEPTLEGEMTDPALAEPIEPTLEGEMTDPALDEPIEPTLEGEMTDPALDEPIEPTLEGEMTDPATQDMMGEEQIIGDANALALLIVRDYLETRDANLLSDMAVLNPGTTTAATGRDMVAEEHRQFFDETFTNTQIQPIRYLVSDRYVFAEFRMSGTHSGDFNNIGATGLDTNLRMLGVFEVDNDQIVSMSLYYDQSQMWEQLGYQRHSEDVPATVTGEQIDGQELDNVYDNPEEYFGQPVRFEGLIGDSVGERAFFLREDVFWEWLFGADDILVIAATDQAMEAVFLEDTRVQVSGTIERYTAAELEGQFGLTGMHDRLDDYEGRAVVMADQIVNVDDDIDSIGNLHRDPEAFYDTFVEIDGIVNEDFGPSAFAIREDVFLGNIFGANRILVLTHEAGGWSFDDLEGEHILVRGTARMFNRAELVAEYGIEDRDGLDSFEDLPVVIAEEIFTDWD